MSWESCIIQVRTPISHAALTSAALSEAMVMEQAFDQGGTFISCPVQVQTPSCVPGSVKKASSSPWSCCKALWGASRKATSTSPSARSSSFWGRNWVLKDRGQEIDIFMWSHVWRMKNLMGIFFLCLKTGACTEIYCSSLWWPWARITLISVSWKAAYL